MRIFQAIVSNLLSFSYPPDLQQLFLNRFLSNLFVILILLFFPAVTNIFAQSNGASSTYQVKGRIISKTDNTPVEFASLVLYNANDSTPVDYTATDI